MTTENFGEAVYVPGRHRKNPVLVYTSRKDRNKVYEFMIATKYRIPGLVSWKCVSCSRVKNGYRNLGAELNRKIPLILVDNNIIKEDPERPLNAEHFCNGKDAIEAVVDRARIEFIHQYGNKEPSSSKIEDTISEFAREAVSSTPIALSTKDKRHVQQTIGAKCLPLLHGVNKRRRWKQHKESTGVGQYERDEEAILEMGAGPSNAEPLPETSGNKRSLKPTDDLEYETTTSIKQSRMDDKPMHFSPPHTVMVRPLPPNNVPQVSSSPYHQHTYQNFPNHIQDEYYDNEEIERLFLDGDLISGDQQQVAYSIEL